MSDLHLTRAQSRRYDELAIKQFGMPSIVLMENAARNCVEVMRKLGVGGAVLVVCGRGNNGGDGFAIARHLDLLGYTVQVVEAEHDGPYSVDAEINRAILRKSGWELHRLEQLEPLLANATWCVDALLGTGARGAPRAPLDGVLATLNAAACTRVAVDISSGLDCDSGVAADCTFVADHTCTFVAAKRGMQQPAAQRVCGQIHVVDVGAPRIVLEQLCQETQPN